MAEDPRPLQSVAVARVRVSIVFESGARIGPGKAKLLESIRDTGSISAAARDMGCRATRDLLKSFGWGIAALHRLHAATKLPSLAARPIASLGPIAGSPPAAW